MNVDSTTGWLGGTVVVESPNSDERPPDATLDLIVVHGISLPPGRFGEGWIDRFFLNELPAVADPYFATIAEMKVSAHVLVARDGALTQYVSFNRRAWHAGRSYYCGRDACNDFSVGIELEGTDDLPYMQVQYKSARGSRRARCVAAYRRCATPRSSVTATSRPGRKTDPGAAFDWARCENYWTGARDVRISAETLRPRQDSRPWRQRTSSAPPSAREPPRHDEQQVREPVQIAQHLGVQRVQLRRGARHAARRADIPCARRDRRPPRELPPGSTNP